MPRRCYWIRMGTGFKHKRLKEYVRKHRGELLAALLTLARAWFVAGRPEPKLTPVGSFEDWSVIIGGILQRVGIEGRLYEQADIDTVQWEAFLKTLDSAFNSEPFMVSLVWERMNERTWNESTRRTELLDRAEELRAALPDFIAQAMDREGFFKQRLGLAARLVTTDGKAHRAGVRTGPLGGGFSHERRSPVSRCRHASGSRCHDYLRRSQKELRAQGERQRRLLV
jgi:hypothetical protein